MSESQVSSNEPRWRSLVRPAGLWLVYALIALAVPAGILAGISPEAAARVTAGFRGWLEAIPEALYMLMGVVFTGYTAARTVDKRGSR
ncbi:Holin of 3TMs, for gene-transfer release [uncultured Caudovirales phage]|uniref:Holin of 3TMs, for gene-transfer release n=1 Tax=uncultured Caudovirales phage TaxID=2100421 RepID=A0A6J5M315_9CAUD|nr:Holin of 3TMs, for gene-transfer release [uncultured Caudovirales phage]